MVSIPFWKGKRNPTTHVAHAAFCCGGPSVLLANVTSDAYLRLLLLESAEPENAQLRLFCNGCVEMALLDKLPQGKLHLLSELAFQQLTVELPAVGQVLSERHFRQRLNVLAGGPLMVRLPRSSVTQLFCYYGVWLNHQEMTALLDLTPAKPGWRLRTLDIPLGHWVIAPSASELLECLPNFMLTHDLVAISSLIADHLYVGGK